METIVSNFNSFAFNWVLRRPNLSRNVSYLRSFIAMNIDGYVDVRLNCLDDLYYLKHIDGKEHKYCDLFIETIAPDLLRFIEENKIDFFRFTFIFSGKELRTTRILGVEAKQT